MMLILCDRHKYMAGRLTPEHLAEYIIAVKCPTCFVDQD